MSSRLVIWFKHWLHETDKLQHILVSLVLVQVALQWLAPWEAVAFAFAVGLIKEVYDKLFRNGFSWGDILANTLGVLLGLLLMLSSL